MAKGSITKPEEERELGGQHGGAITTHTTEEGTKKRKAEFVQRGGMGSMAIGTQMWDEWVCTGTKMGGRLSRPCQRWDVKLVGMIVRKENKREKEKVLSNKAIFQPFPMF